MREVQRRELQVLCDADASPKLRKHYSYKDDPELAATARRLAMAPVPHVIKIEEPRSPTPDGARDLSDGNQRVGQEAAESLASKAGG